MLTKIITTITDALPYGFFETDLQKRRDIKFFRGATTSDIKINTVGSLMHFVCETTEFDTLAIEGVSSSMVLMRIVMNDRKFSDVHRERPDLIAHLLRKHIEIHGHSNVRDIVVRARENETPQFIAAIRILTGFEQMAEKPYPGVLCSFEDAMCRYLTGPMTAHEWIELTRSLGCVEEVLANPQKVYDYFLERPALLDI